MRKIYDEYLYVPEPGEGKVRERVFFARLALAIISIVLCMFAMGYNAYAHFTSNIGSTSNVLQTSTYTLEITPMLAVEGKGSVATATDATTEHKYTLQPGQYHFKLKKPDTATASTGYCRIDVGEADQNGVVEYKSSFYTQQIGKVANSDTPINERTVTISVDKETVIRFVPCWGTYAGAETNAETYLTDDMAIQSKEQVITKVDASSLANVSAASESDLNKSEQQIGKSQVTSTPESSGEGESGNVGDSTIEEQKATE